MLGLQHANAPFLPEEDNEEEEKEEDEEEEEQGRFKENPVSSSVVLRLGIVATSPDDMQWSGIIHAVQISAVP